MAESLREKQMWTNALRLFLAGHDVHAMAEYQKEQQLLQQQVSLTIYLFMYRSFL